MDFEKKYNQIKSLVKQDLEILEVGIAELFSGENPLENKILRLLSAPAKRLRPLLAILYLRALNLDISDKQRKTFLAVELIHNASLIHDDVLDSANERRGETTINSDFDNNLAVVAGDYLLSVSLEQILSTDSIAVMKLFAGAMKKTCLGEINQFFSKYKTTTIEDYVEKSKEKTAFLFELAVISGLELCDEISVNDKAEAKIFAQNFGIAFQIRDDLINFLKYKNLKSGDIEEGIYTAPIIFAEQEMPDLLKNNNLLENLNNTKCIEKTKDLMDNYFDKAASIILKLNDSVYKKSLLDIINLLKKSV